MHRVEEEEEEEEEEQEEEGGGDDQSGPMLSDCRLGSGGNHYL